jgi:hypothetical protein
MRLLATPLRAFLQHRLSPQQIRLSVYADGVAGSLGHVKGNAIFKQPQLLQPLDLLQRRGRQRGEPLQRGLAIGINSQVLAVGAEASPIAVKGNGCAGKVERATIESRDHLDGVGVSELLRGQRTASVAASTCGRSKSASSGEKNSGVSVGSSP